MHIYVKGRPEEKQKEASPRGFEKMASREMEDMEEEVDIKGEEYSHSMNLLKQHQEMMNRRSQDSKKGNSPKVEVYHQRSTEEDDRRNRGPTITTYAPSQNYRPHNFQQMPNYQPYNPPADPMLQKRIEQFTQQMTASMNNLQNFVRNEMAHVKQRLGYLESKVESIARRQNELELDRLNQSHLKGMNKC